MIRSAIVFCAFLAIGFFYLGTLRSHTINPDEIAFSDFAINGNHSVWKTIVPAGNVLAESAYGFGASPIYIDILNRVLTEFGRSIWVARFLPMASTVAGLLFVCLLARKHVGEPAFILVTLGITQLFYEVSHNVRPEGI